MKRYGRITSTLFVVNIGGLVVIGIIGVFLGMAAPFSPIYREIARNSEADNTIQELHRCAQQLVAQVQRVYEANTHFALAYCYGFVGLEVLFLVNILCVNTTTLPTPSGYERQMPGVGLGFVLVGLGLLHMMIQYPSTPAVSARLRANDYQAVHQSTDLEHVQVLVNTLSDRVQFTQTYSKIQSGIYGAFLCIIGGMIGRIVLFLHRVRQYHTEILDKCPSFDHDTKAV